MAAVLNLRPGAQVSINADDTDQITYYDDTIPPTVAELQTECDRLDAAYAASAYRRARAEAYASWGDQLDLQYHDLLDDTTTWRDHVAAVKAANPKP